MRLLSASLLGSAILTIVPGAAATEAPAILVTFLNALKANDRNSAIKLIAGEVSQLDGSPGELSGGSNAGKWQNRLIFGQEALAPAKAFQLIEGCELRSFSPFHPDANKPLQVRVIYNCPTARAVHFLVYAQPGGSVVHLSEIGQSPYVVSEGKALLWGLTE